MAERIPGFGGSLAADDELFAALGALGSHGRVCAGRTGLATAVRNEWLRLAKSTIPASVRVERLVGSAVAAGASETAVRSVLEATRERIERLGDSRERLRQGLARRERLEAGHNELTRRT